MLDKGEGVQKYENFVDVINGCPLSPVVGCLFVLLGRACAARRGSRPSVRPVRPSGQSHICHKTLNIQQIEEPSNFIEKGEINLILGSPPSQDPGKIMDFMWIILQIVQFLGRLFWTKENELCLIHLIVGHHLSKSY